MTVCRIDLSLLLCSESGSEEEESKEEDEEEDEEESEGSSSDEGDALETLQKRFGVVPAKRKTVSTRMYIHRAGGDGYFVCSLAAGF